MTKPFVWSATSLGQALTCLYAYYLERKKKVKTPLPAPMAFGADIHRVIEIAHSGQKGKFHSSQERPLYFADAQALVGFWKGYWYRQRGPNSLMGKETAWRDEKQFWELMHLGGVLLGGGQVEYQGSVLDHKGYYQSILNPPLPVVSIKVEEDFNVSFGGYRVKGRFDQIWELKDGGFALVDITTGYPKDVKRVQLTVYAQAFLQVFGQLPRYLLVWHLRSNVLLPAQRGDEDFEKLRRQLRFAAENIQAGHFVEADTDVVCRSCRFLNICDRSVLGSELPLGVESDELNSWPGDLPGNERQKPHPEQMFFPGWVRGKKVHAGRKTSLID